MMKFFLFLVSVPLTEEHIIWKWCAMSTIAVNVFMEGKISQLGTFGHIGLGIVSDGDKIEQAACYLAFLLEPKECFSLCFYQLKVCCMSV